MLLSFLSRSYLFQQACPYFKTLQASSSMNRKPIILNTAELLPLLTASPSHADELPQAPWLLTCSEEPCSHCWCCLLWAHWLLKPWRLGCRFAFQYSELSARVRRAGVLPLEAQWDLRICVSWPTIISMCSLNECREGRLSSCLVSITVFGAVLHFKTTLPPHHLSPARWGICPAVIERLGCD